MRWSRVKCARVMARKRTENFAQGTRAAVAVGRRRSEDAPVFKPWTKTTSPFEFEEKATFVYSILVPFYVFAVG